MAEETIWQLGIDAGEAITTLEELGSALDALIEKFAAVGSSAGDLSAVDDALATLGTSSADSTAEVDGLTEALASMSATIAEDTQIIDGLNATVGNLQAQLAALTEAESGTTEADLALGAAKEETEAKVQSFSESLQAAQGPLMMLSMAGLMLGKSLYDAGAQGQEGEALLRGMAGASTADIQALEQEALKLGVNMQEASAGFYEVESAGYAGSQAITVFDDAMKLAEGGQAQAKDVMTGLTAIMHDYNYTADQAGQVTGIMAEAQFRGKQSMQDLATSIGPLAAAGKKAGESFQEVAAAEATMTQINPHVRQDAMQLAALFDSLDPKMGKVEKTAQSLGLSFDDAHYKSLDLLGKLQYLAQIAGGDTTPAFAKLAGGVRGATAATDLLQGKASTFISFLHDMGNSAGATENAFKDWENTVPAHMDKVSAAFSVFSTRFMDAIGPKVIPLIDNLATGIGKAADFITAHIDMVMPVLAGLAAFFGGAIVATIASFVISLGWVAVILAGIAVAVGGAVYAWQHWGQIVGQTNGILQNPVIQTIWHVLQGIGAFLAATFIPVWQQLVTTWNTQLLPAFRSLGNVLQPIMPLLQGLAVVIGAVLVVALGGIVAMLTGVIRGFALFLQGAIQAVGGFVQIVTGLVQIVSAVLGFIYDLFSGNWSHLRTDMEVFAEGFANLWSGLGNAIMGILNAFGGAVGGFFVGFFQGIINYFETLYNAVVGHSIIPDMVNGIINWLEQLPGRAAGALAGFISAVTSALASAASAAVQGGANIVNGIANGIRGAIGAVTGAISDVASAIAAHLPHSPAKEGPLRELLLQGSLITDQISEGMLSHLPKLQGAINQLAQPIALGISAPALNLPSPGVLTASMGLNAGNDQSTQLLAQAVAYLAQMVQLQQRGQGGNLTLNNTFGGAAINPQQLGQVLQGIFGSNYESMQRGGY